MTLPITELNDNITNNYPEPFTLYNDNYWVGPASILVPINIRSVLAIDMMNHVIHLGGGNIYKTTSFAPVEDEWEMTAEVYRERYCEQQTIDDQLVWIYKQRLFY